MAGEGNLLSISMVGINRVFYECQATYETWNHMTMTALNTYESSYTTSNSSTKCLSLIVK